MTNYKSASKVFGFLMGLSLVVTTGSFGFPIVTHAQDDSGYGSTDAYSDELGSTDAYPDSSGSTDAYPDALGSTDAYPDSLGSTDTYSDELGSTDAYPDSYGSTDAYPDSYGSTDAYPDSYGSTDAYPSYSYDTPTYSSSYGSGYSSTPGYGSNVYSTPGYGSAVYSTPGLGGGYASNFSSIPATGYTAPVGYNAPVQQQQQQQSQPRQQQQPQQAAAAAQPIIINNTNTNTNNNPNTNTLVNTNTAPVTQVAAAPVQYIAASVAPVTVYRNAPSVSLNQIPYTGFDFGPVGDAIYWMALLAFAVAAAYLLVYYRGGAFTLATALVTGRSTIKPVTFTEAHAEESIAPASAEGFSVAKPAAPIPAPVNARAASVMDNLPTAEVRRMTSDAMILNHSKSGEAPRIVITRG